MKIRSTRSRVVAASVVALLSSAGCDGATPSMAADAGAGPTVADIQGSGDTSPLEGRIVTVTALVSGDFQNGDADTLNNLGGFFVQQEPPDSNPLTSDGVFVFDGNNARIDVSVGDRVTVTGSVNEHFGETQIKADAVTIVGSGTPRATDIELPAAAAITNGDGELIADLERYEGMLVRFPQPLTVTNLRFLGRFGEVGLSQGGRLFQFTNDHLPDRTGYAEHVASNAVRSIILDDGRRAENPADVRYLNAGETPDYSIRAGDSITGMTGNLRYARGSGGNGLEAWRLMPTDAISFARVNPRPGAPDVTGTIRVASFNMLNFFSRIDSGAPICGPAGDAPCRGADSAKERQRQLDKSTAALALMNADIVGLMELENNASESIETIVTALNERVGSDNYAYIDTGTIHTDAIKVGFIYNAGTVRPSGTYALLDADVDPRFDTRRNRPALAQTFAVIETGAAFTVVVGHLKSKSSSCEGDGDPNVGDGQGNCNRTRTRAAAALADWIETDPTGSGDPDFLLIGDLNAYPMEDPVTTLQEAGLVNLLDVEGRPYSFTFDAQVGALDHALASPSLLGQINGAIEWHINADEPPLLDYNLEYGRNPSLFDPNSPYRASDHDPVLVDLDPAP